eukprot:Protomagalhaensia_wolfi_Nauph_80__434@NODE_123_length_3572_cov_63_628644_g3_i1_p1_GENE_NODE_123_length_3572_cov_63_628644_g3_i1NODE_123_length_3572_cov_63_628644_g3_i1_p1_ORF_typecomplete_len559_score89_93Corona_3/PF04694_12/0_3YppF/PF14178_6/0_41_NODE_123_length_3572_cov_63_628644_g3_i19452621
MMKLTTQSPMTPCSHALVLALNSVANPIANQFPAGMAEVAPDQSASNQLSNTQSFSEDAYAAVVNWLYATPQEEVERMFFSHENSTDGQAVYERSSEQKICEPREEASDSIKSVVLEHTSAVLEGTSEGEEDRSAKPLSSDSACILRGLLDPKKRVHEDDADQEGETRARHSGKRPRQKDSVESGPNSRVPKVSNEQVLNAFKRGGDEAVWSKAEKVLRAILGHDDELLPFKIRLLRPQFVNVVKSGSYPWQIELTPETVEFLKSDLIKPYRRYLLWRLAASTMKAHPNDFASPPGTPVDSNTIVRLSVKDNCFLEKDTQNEVDKIWHIPSNGKKLPDLLPNKFLAPKRMGLWSAELSCYECLRPMLDLGLTKRHSRQSDWIAAPLKEAARCDISIKEWKEGAWGYAAAVLNALDSAYFADFVKLRFVKGKEQHKNYRNIVKNLVGQEDLADVFRFPVCIDWVPDWKQRLESLKYPFLIVWFLAACQIDLRLHQACLRTPQTSEPMNRTRKSEARATQIKEFLLADVEPISSSDPNRKLIVYLPFLTVVEENWKPVEE